MKNWWLAARPKTLWVAFAPVMMGTAIAWQENHFHAASALAALIGALLIQVGTNFANDYFDFVKGADTEDRVGPKRLTQSGEISPQTMKKAFIITFLLVAFPAIYILYRGGEVFLWIGLASIASGILYTGGPYPLAYLGIADFFTLIFFGPVAVAGTHYLQALEFSSTAIIAGGIPGLMSAAVLTVNNLRDVDNDRVASKKTLVVRFGVLFGRVEYTICILGSLSIFIYLLLAKSSPLIPLAVVFILAIFTARVGKTIWTSRDPSMLNAALPQTAKFLFIYSLLFSLLWIFLS